MVVLIKAAQLILSLSILVILHEFGHFIFAKAFKCRVEKFYLFFNPWFALFKYKKGETEYGVGWLPLGGYVKISGMIDESMDKEQMKKPPQPWEFRSKPAYQRLLIMIGGVLFNLIFALFLYSMILFTWGEQYLPTENAKYGIVVNEVGREIGLENGDKVISVGGEKVEEFRRIVPTMVFEDVEYIEIDRNGERIKIPISSETIAKIINAKEILTFRKPYSIIVKKVIKDSPAKEAGLEKEDKILSIDGNTFQFYDQYAKYMGQKKGESVDVVVERNGEERNFVIKLDEKGLLGVQREYDLEKYFEFATIEYGLLESFPAGVKKGVDKVKEYLKHFKLLFRPETKAYESLGGFISIGNIFPSVWDWYSFWYLTAFLSIILAVMNMLPIPALDGGHVLFLMYEIVSGKKPSEKFLEYAQIAGMILLFALLIYANGNDIVKLFNK